MVGQDDTGCFKLRINSIDINILSGMRALFPKLMTLDLKRVEQLSEEKKMLPTISASNRCCQPWSINHRSHSWWCSLREVRDGKHRVSAQVMKMCSEWKSSRGPHACIFPYIETSKITNLGTLFLVIHSSLLMFSYIFFSQQKLPCIPTTPLLHWNSSSELSERLLPGLESSGRSQNKT